MKKCRKCAADKPLQEFGSKRANKDGHDSICLECSRKRDRERWPRRAKASRDWLNSHPEKRKQYGLNRKFKFYNVPTDKRDDVTASLDDGCCEICGLKKKLYVDHNHDTGEYRGLLCNGCNFALGQLKDNVQWFANAIVYLRKHSHSSKMFLPLGDSFGVVCLLPRHTDD
jgi:Recombination endonuclease VII